MKRFFHSIFTKLLLAVAVTGLCINIFVLGYFMHIARDSFKTPLRKNVIHYMHYLIDDMGDPPSLALAKKMAEEFSYDISYQSPGLSWSTAETPPQARSRRMKIVYEDPTAVIQHAHGGDFIITVKTENGEFTFSPRKRMNDFFGGHAGHILVLGVLSFFLFLGYLAIRRMMKPIKWLSEGVRQISDGNLDHIVPGHGSDELGQLTDAFNAMTERIRAMLLEREQLMLDVSHELRTPLTRMKVALEFIPEGKARENIRADVSEMDNMIAEILETARLRNARGRLKKDRVNLAALVRETAAFFEDQQPGVIVQDTPDCVKATVVPELVKTVLKNVFTNAVKYSEKDGTPAAVTVRSASGTAIIEVRDWGVGIPQEELPHIFEPFYRVDKSRSQKTGGYGLGLNLCKTIMDAHNGKIEAKSAVGKGTTISLVFPESGQA